MTNPVLQCLRVTVDEPSCRVCHSKAFRKSSWQDCTLSARVRQLLLEPPDGFAVEYLDRYKGRVLVTRHSSPCSIPIALTLMAHEEAKSVASQTVAQANYDARKHICAPWYHAARGGPANLVVTPAFADGLKLKKDEFGNLHQQVVTNSAIGCGYGPPHPPAAQAWALNFKSMQAHILRNEEALSLIKLIYGHEKEVEEEIDARIVLLYGAPTRVAIDAANAAILAANQNNALAAQGAQGAPAAVAVPAAAVVCVYSKHRRKNPDALSVRTGRNDSFAELDVPLTQLAQKVKRPWLLRRKKYSMYTRMVRLLMLPANQFPARTLMELSQHSIWPPRAPQLPLPVLPMLDPLTTQYLLALK